MLFGSVSVYVEMTVYTIFTDTCNLSVWLLIMAYIYSLILVLIKSTCKSLSGCFVDSLQEYLEYREWKKDIKNETNTVSSLPRTACEHLVSPSLYFFQLKMYVYFICCAE